jgi:diguanylate cyclase (GGDEF)-like protein
MEPTTQSVAALVARNEELQAELAHYKQLALYDSLTGLLNKRGFDEELRRTVSVIFRTMENTQRRLGRHMPLIGTDCTIVGIDLDYFKRINDEHPDHHLAGDRVLKEFAKLLSQVFARESDIVARTGGDEFIAVLPHTKPEDAEDLCHGLRIKMSDQSDVFCYKTIKITTSVGTTTLQVSSTANSVDAIVAKAMKRMELALYRAKRNGRDQIQSKVVAIRLIPPQEVVSKAK